MTGTVKKPNNNTAKLSEPTKLTSQTDNTALLLGHGRKRPTGDVVDPPGLPHTPSLYLVLALVLSPSPDHAPASAVPQGDPSSSRAARPLSLSGARSLLRSSDAGSFQSLLVGRRPGPRSDSGGWDVDSGGSGIEATSATADRTGVPALLCVQCHAPGPSTLAVSSRKCAVRTVWCTRCLDASSQEPG